MVHSCTVCVHSCTVCGTPMYCAQCTHVLYMVHPQTNTLSTTSLTWPKEAVVHKQERAQLMSQPKVHQVQLGSGVCVRTDNTSRSQRTYMYTMFSRLDDLTTQTCAQNSGGGGGGGVLKPTEAGYIRSTLYYTVRPDQDGGDTHRWSLKPA